MMRTNFRQAQGQKGQAMIEFVLGLMIVISFFFFYVRMCAVFAVGNYIHYATFMAARAYTSSSDSESAQKDNATAVLSSMLKGRFKSLIKPKDGDGSLPGATIGPGSLFAIKPESDTWNQGVSFHYTSKLALYPWSRDHQSIVMDLTSESWSAREETTAECKDTINAVKKKLNEGGITDAVIEWDNGGSPDGCT